MEPNYCALLEHALKCQHVIANILRHKRLLVFTNLDVYIETLVFTSGH